MPDNGQATREAFFATCEKQFKDVTIPRLGEVRLRSMSVREYTAIEVAAEDAKIPRDKRASLFKVMLIANAVCDSDNNRLFTTNEDELEKLQEMDSAVASFLGNEIVDFCGLTAQVIEEAEKN